MSPINMSPPEHKEQIAFVKWLDKIEKIKAYHFPPGRKGGYEGFYLKSMGVKSGVADLFIPSCFLWVEMKRKDGGILSTIQKSFRDEMLVCGYSYIEAHGFIEAKRKFLIWRDKYEKDGHFSRSNIFSCSL